MSGLAGRCAFRLVTAPPQPAGGAHARAAIAMLALWGDVDAAFACLGLAPVRTGEVRLRRFAAIDRGLRAAPDVLAHAAVEFVFGGVAL